MSFHELICISKNERSLFGKSFVFVTYKYEWSIVDNESWGGKSSQVYLPDENEIPVFREFPFPKATNRSQECFSTEYICCCRVLYPKKPQLRVILAQLELVRGLTLETSIRHLYLLTVAIWVSSTPLLPNLGVLLSNLRHTLQFVLETDHSSL